MVTTLDKPAGLPVMAPHRGPGDSLLARLLAREPGRADVPWPEGFEGGIVHRLDNETSGAVLVADDVDELLRLRDAFAAGALCKTYWLLAARDVDWDDHVCDRAIGHAPRHRGRMVVQRGARTAHRGKWYPAETRFHRLEGRLFAATMRTGVMHQIRVHAAFLGMPLAGDSRYGGGPGGFALHHVGLAGPGVTSAPVSPPEWAVRVLGPERARALARTATARE